MAQQSCVEQQNEQQSLVQQQYNQYYNNIMSTTTHTNSANQYCYYWPVVTSSPSTLTFQQANQYFDNSTCTAFTPPIQHNSWNYQAIPTPQTLCSNSFYTNQHLLEHQGVDYEPESKRRRRVPQVEDNNVQTTNVAETVVIRRQCISKKNAKRLKRLKHLRNFFTASYQHSTLDPCMWCFHFWLETLREIKLSQSGFERITAKLKELSPFMAEAINELSMKHQIDTYMLLAAVISLPFVAENELTVERSFVTFCDLIEDILKINGILESELYDKYMSNSGMAADLKADLKPKKARLSVIVSNLFSIVNDLKAKVTDTFTQFL